MSISVAIVIPVYREASYIEKTLHSIEKSVQYSFAKHRVPNVILVINNPISVSSAFRQDNLDLIRNLGDVKLELSYPVDILDYTNPGLTNGVGEARKIGMGFAISKYLQDPQDRVVSLDADCIVDDQYLEVLYSKPLRGSAFTLYFEHELSSSHIIFYELYLRYLRWGLKLAESPFSFYSVGSCLGTTVECYQKVGGMVSKSATEDFHFLNKLRKHGCVDYWTDTTVRPSNRLSERVTLGTGYFLTHAKKNFDQNFKKLLIPRVDHFGILKSILALIFYFDGDTSLKDKFAELGQDKLYGDLHERRIIEKIHQIFETTANAEAYRKRILEAVDGIETLRMLRTLSRDDRDTMTKEKFMEQANQLWKTNLDPEGLLIEVRNREKTPSVF